MMHARRKRRGFTLLEMLVAISMVSLLTLTGVYAMRAGFLSLEKTGANIAESRRVLGARRVLEQALGGFLPAQAECHGGDIDVVQRVARTKAKGLFFEGTRQSLRFVSSFSLEEAHRGAPRIMEIAVIPGANGEGLRLIVNEHLYWGPSSTGYFCAGPRPPNPVTGQSLLDFFPIQTSPRSFILADRLSAVRIQYRLPTNQPPFFDWLDEWPFASAIPAAIRIEMRPLDESARATIVTAPILALPDFTDQRPTDNWTVRRIEGTKWDDR